MSTNTRKTKFSNIAIFGTSFVGLIGLCFLSFNHYREKYWQQSLDSVWNEFEQWEGKQQHLRKQLSSEQERWISQILAQKEEIRYLRDDVKNLSLEVRKLTETQRRMKGVNSGSTKPVLSRQDEMAAQGKVPRPVATREKPQADPNFFD